MLNLKNALAILIVSILVVSCQPKDIEIDLPEHEPKLSIFSQVIPDQVILVTVTKSFNSLVPEENLQQDSNFINSLMVSNAIVKVTFGGKTEVLENVSPGIYISTNTLQVPNQEYFLEVIDPATGLTCSASSVMLPRVELDSVKASSEIKGSDTTFTLEYNFTDMAGKDNYYLLTYRPLSTKLPGRNNPFVNINPVNDTYQLLSDKLFKSPNYKGKMNITGRIGDTIAVSLVNISEEYYKYLVVYQKSGKIFNQLTGEPIDFPTNVKNGFGFFTTHNPDVHIIEL